MPEEREVKARLSIEREGDAEAFRETADDIKGLDENAQSGIAGLEELRKHLQGMATEAAQLGAELRSGVSGALLEAVDALNRFEAAAAKGLGSSGQQAAAAKLAIQQYEAALRDAAAAGQQIGEGQVEALRELQAGYDATIGKLGQLKTAQQEVRRELQETTAETGGQVRGFTTLEGALERIGGKFGALAIKALAFFQAFELGSSLGTKLRDVLNNLTDNGFDRLIQKGLGFEAVMRRIVGVKSEAAQAAENYANNLNILRNRGIDPTGLSAEQAQAKVEQLNAEFFRGNQELQAFSERLGVSKQRLDETTSSLVDGVRRFQEANEQLSQQDLAELFGPQIDEVLEQYDRLNQEVPEKLGSLVEELSLHTQRARQEHERWAESVGVSRKRLDELSSSLAANIAVFEAANQQLSNQQLAKVFGDEIAEIVKQYQRLGLEPPAEIQKLIEAWGLLVSKTGEAVGTHDGLVQQLRDQITGASTEIREEVDRLASALPEALQGVNLDELRIADPQQFAQARELIQGWVEDFRSAGEQIPLSLAEAATKMDIFIGALEIASGKSTEAAEGIRSVGEAGRESAGGIDEVDLEIQALLARYGEIGPAVSEAAEESSSAGDRLLEAGEKAAEGAEGLTEQAAAASEAGARLSDAARGSQDLASGQDQAAQSVLATDDALAGLESRLATFDRAISGLGSRIRDEFAGAQGFAEPILSELDLIIQRAAAAEQALAGVVGDGATAAPEAP